MGLCVQSGDGGQIAGFRPETMACSSFEIAPSFASRLLGVSYGVGAAGSPAAPADAGQFLIVNDARSGCGLRSRVSVCGPHLDDRADCRLEA